MKRPHTLHDKYMIRLCISTWTSTCNTATQKTTHKTRNGNIKENEQDSLGPSADGCDVEVKFALDPLRP